jgi:TetR/AcrR family transcriptional regulator, transcriptional repressor for nem operon
MPRKKSYERQALESRALGVFAARGYQGASTERLVEALGVNRNSVYAEFGSKEGLFAATLVHYEREVVDRLFGPLESHGADLAQIEGFFRNLGVSAEGSVGLGCLMCNTAAELGGANPGLQPFIERHFARMQRAFLNALRGAMGRRQVSRALDAAAEARFLAASTVGICLMVRAGLAVEMSREAIDGALSHLEALRGTGPAN